MQKRLLFPFIIISFILFLASSGDAPDGNTGAPFDGLCSSCHSGGAYDGNVSISGFPSNISPNTTYSITLTATATMGTPLKGGFQLVSVFSSNSNAGDLSAGTGSGTSTFNSREYIDHRGSKSFSGNTVSWTFNWTSPNGPNGATVTMYYVANLANGNGSSSGDFIVNDNTTGTIVGGGVPLSVNIISKKNVTCFGGSDGEATASAGGGNPPYTYSWSNGDVGNKALNLTAGSYRVTATDNNGITATASTIITQPAAINHEFKVTKNVTCPGGKDGSVLASATGGTPPYNIIYSSGSPNNLFAGNYTVTVSDANQCTVTSSVTVTEPDSFAINPVIFENPSCPLDSNGQIKIAVSGATAPYKYLWTSGEISAQILNKKVGNYKVTITDNKNCITVRGYELKSFDNQSPNLIAKNSKAYLNATGKAIPKISDYIVENKDNCDAAPTLSINIDTFRCNQVGKKNYIITSTDASGNKAFDTIEIEVLDTLKPVLKLWKDTLIQRCDAIVPGFSATDNCGVTEFRKLSGPDQGSVFPIGISTLIYLAKDGSGNTTIDSFKVTVSSPLHYSIDSVYFNVCKGDSVFTVVSVKHDLHSFMNFEYNHDTTKILQDSSFTISTTNQDSVAFQLWEGSGCNAFYKKEVIYPGIPLVLDSFKITNSSADNGVVEVFISGKVDSLAWYNANTNTYVNNTGAGLSAGVYIVKAYYGPCVFEFGPYEVKQIVAVSNPGSLELKAYPVPFKSEIILSSEMNSKLSYTLISAQGRVIQKGEFNRKLQINASDLSAGIYYIRCSGLNRSETVRLIKI